MTWLLGLLGIGGIGAALIFIPGLAAKAIEALSALLSLIRTHPWPCAVIALCALSAWLWQGKRTALVERDRAGAESKANFDAHVRTIRNYRKAQNDAKGLEEKRLARVKTEQQGINTDASQSYARRLADLRARYERLRRDAAARAGSAPGGQSVPGLSPAPGGTVEAPTDPLERELTCDTQAIQLDELITWIERQHRIDPNAGN